MSCVPGHTPPHYEWAIIYEDGTRFTSHDGEPWESPSWGAVLIAQPGQEFDVLGDRDYFLFRKDLAYWMVTDFVGLIDQLTTRARDITCVRVGRMIPNRTDWQAIRKPVVIEVRGK